MSGFKTLAIPGPTNLPFRVRQAMDVALEDHRAPDFPELTLSLFRDLKKVFRTQSGHIILFPGSGTGGWESAISNTLSPGDAVLISVFGQFSHLWSELCRRWGLEVHQIDCDWGSGVPLDLYEKALAADTSHAIRAVLVCHNETATGVTSSVAAVRGILERLKHPALLMVDGVSSIGAIDFRMDEWGVDVAVCGSQKGFMLPTGLTMVGVSQRALEAKKSSQFPKSFFDYDEMLKSNKDGYFPYTPATTLLRGLRASLDMLFEEGLENVAARHRRLAEGVRRAAAAWNLQLCAKAPHWYSDTVSAIVVPDRFNANDVIKTAYNRYGLSLGSGLSKINGKVFRIGHLGHVNEIMCLAALGGTEMALKDVGIPIKPGAGVGAAVSYYTENAK